MARSPFTHFHHEPPAAAQAEGDREFGALTASLQHIRLRESPSAEAAANFPNFLILGPQRTGTTWLYHNLKKHPQVFLPRKKETYFFTTLNQPDHPHRHFDTLDDFLEGPMRESPRHRLKRHYDCLRKYQEPYRPLVRGEATATNALLPVPVIREAVALNPGLKAILMLRNPVERAWSHARKDLMRNTGRPLNDIPQAGFERFFRASGQRALADYTSQIRRWQACLLPGHLFIGEFEMIASSPEKLLTGIQRFLGIRTGRKYFNRHLRERINASGNETSQRQTPVPPQVEEHLTSLLAVELAQYHRIRETLDPAKRHRTLRDRVVQQTKPVSRKNFHPAA